ncbi:hypothetical protein OHS58_30385 [Amycolatopsis sp. NBC_00348]
MDRAATEAGTYERATRALSALSPREQEVADGRTRIALLTHDAGRC